MFHCVKLLNLDHGLSRFSQGSFTKSNRQIEAGMTQVITSLESQFFEKIKDLCVEMMVLLHHLIDYSFEYFMVRYFEHLSFSDHARVEMVI